MQSLGRTRSWPEESNDEPGLKMILVMCHDLMPKSCPMVQLLLNLNLLACATHSAEDAPRQKPQAPIPNGGDPSWTAPP